MKGGDVQNAGYTMRTQTTEGSNNHSQNLTKNWFIRQMKDKRTSVIIEKINNLSLVGMKV